MDIEIRSLATIHEVRACETLQSRAWSMSDNLDVVPAHLLVSVQRNGGLLLGAFRGDVLVGFVFGFPGVTADGKAKHCSYMMGVDPEVQSEGIGYRLKLAQREFALGRGYDLVTWNYDALESRNANLNVHKLGGVCRIYVPDFYGPLGDGLNRGLPSDRFQLDWWIASQWVGRRLEAKWEHYQAQTPVNSTRSTARGLLAPASARLDAREPAIWVEIPANYQAIKAADPGLAMEWRLATREIFQSYLAAGYTVIDFSRLKADGGQRSLYLLSSGVEP